VVGLTGLVLGLSRGGISGRDDPLTIASLLVGAVLLPLFVLIERRPRAAMLDLSIFADRGSRPPLPRRSSTGCRASR
jgi:hypothetical protein